jgi:hypothetical protein
MNFTFASGTRLTSRSPAKKSRRPSAIISVSASKSLSFMAFGVPGLRRTLIFSVLMVATLILISCSGYNASAGAPVTSGIKFRAFVSNPLRPTTNGPIPVLQIVAAKTDVLSSALVNMSGASAEPGLMAVFPNKNFTLVFSATGNTVTLVSNANESVAISGNSFLPSIVLPGPTESMFVWTDNATAFAAVSNAPVTGQDNGAVEALNVGSARIGATIPVPNARYITLSHNGNRILAFGNGRDPVTVISPSLIGTNTDPRTIVCPDGTPQSDVAFCDLNPETKVLDRPVGAVFSSDDSLAYILNCGPECGGTAASITVLDMTTNTAGISIPVNAATVGFLQANTNKLFVAGTPPNTSCTSGTTATSCGQLSVIDLGSMTVSTTAEITNGNHNRMEMGANAQLFIGANTCANINTASEVRGCLSIFDTVNSKPVIPPTNNDVTGIAPVPGRNVVYVAQDGKMYIYDTTTDQLQTKQIHIVGQAGDVKIVDF